MLVPCRSLSVADTVCDAVGIDIERKSIMRTRRAVPAESARSKLAKACVGSISRSPWKTRMVTAVWLSSASSEYNCRYLLG